MKAKIISVDKDRREITAVDEHGAEGTFPVGENVKMEFIKLGEAEMSFDKDTRTQLVYIKMIGPTASPNAEGKADHGFPKPASAPESPPAEEKKFYKTKHLVGSGFTNEELRVYLDLASEQHWVIATQTHLVEGKWSVVVYYKEK